MSNKKFDRLSDLDQRLRKAYPVIIGQGTQVTIRKILGFELFNTHPYHNYETWSDGYEATDGIYKVQAEDLDDCINMLCDLKEGKTEAQPWNLVK